MKALRGPRDDARFSITRASRPVALALIAAFAACGQSDGAADRPAGTAHFALELPDAGVIERVDYTIRLTFLETDPPTPTLQESYSSLTFGGELLAILPCTTGADGDGLNQVDIAAKIWVRGRPEPFDASASAVYTCIRNADVLVNVVLNVIAQLDGGFVDIDTIVAGTLCASKVDMKPDGFLGVCASATCGKSEELLVFANECEAVQAVAPTYWICGDPADWQVVGQRANAYFPVPAHDGSWTFGVIALDVFQMAQADPTLTDPDGTVTVWAGLSAVRAYFERQGGETIRRENAPFIYELAAQLEVAPLQQGQPSPEILMLVDQASDPYGARVTWQRRFGACDEAPRGVQLYPGYQALDLRRDGAQAAILTLGDPDTGFATHTARCTTGWTSDAVPMPTLDCDAQTPLLP